MPTFLDQFVDPTDPNRVAAFAAPAPAPVRVLGWTLDPESYASLHERVTRRSHAERIAALKGLQYAGEIADGPPVQATGGQPQGYYVPSDTIVGCELAQQMGIRHEGDLFGGVVPHAYVSTKAISHGLFGSQPAAPPEWDAALAPRIRSSVLDGYTAFSKADARAAGRSLLAAGSVRVKPVRATGGRGQSVALDADALDRQIAEAPNLETDGLVLERNLRKPRTLSIGQVSVGAMRVSYYGLQRLTRNHKGDWVYGGSDLTCVCGDLDVLHGMPLAPSLKLAINQARAYHAAVMETFPGFMASRINYDVAQGRDDAGRWCSGVLEQSWRIGGATGAEIAAMEVFRAEPHRQQVRASCVEVFGEAELPPGARVYFSDIDPAVGRLTKYSFVEPHADPT
ncbi:conserved hypothetical protein [Burkholderiales bacterium 8X]|nr:conserved hypothetical protein [Burkholderiales bacterium 8X]